MDKIRFYFSLLIAKSLYLGLKVTKISQGTSIIGKIVLKIYPDFLKSVNKYIDKKINITGTNGKTTTSGLVSHLIKSDGNCIINNAMGANMLTGVVNAIAVTLNPFIKTDYSIIESDEAYLSKIYDKYDADYLLVTNLFRDQLDRYGELATTKKLIQDGINKKENLILVLNADDPLVASFRGKGGKCSLDCIETTSEAQGGNVYYGIENVVFAEGVIHNDSLIEEAFNCPCGKPLKYSKKFFAQQGHYYCDCGYKRPEPKYKADVVLHKDHSILNIDGEEFYVPLVGLFNAYNALASIALCKELGIKNIQENIKTFKVAFGRSEVKYLNGKRTLIQLIKNPIGANEVLKTVDLSSNLLIVINDNYADGRDVSWLWDAEFEGVNVINKEIVVSGSRAHDMALRLKYAGVNQDKIKVIENISKAVDYVGQKEGNITILPTYTALLEINKMKKLKSKKTL